MSVCITTSGFQMLYVPPPGPPLNLTASPGTFGQINLTWSAAAPQPGTSIAQYIVYRNDQGNWPPVGTSTTPSFSDTGLADLTAYSYYVVAIDSKGAVSVPSNQATATTAGSLAQVTGLTATAVSSSQINLAWTATPNATSYTIRRGGIVIASGVGTSSYNDTGLTASTQYSYTVAADNANGEGPQSASASATTAQSGAAIGFPVMGVWAAQPSTNAAYHQNLARYNYVEGVYNMAQQGTIPAVTDMGAIQSAATALGNPWCRILQYNIMNEWYPSTGASGFFNNALLGLLSRPDTPLWWLTSTWPTLTQVTSQDHDSRKATNVSDTTAVVNVATVGSVTGPGNVNWMQANIWSWLQQYVFGNSHALNAADPVIPANPNLDGIAIDNQEIGCPYVSGNWLNTSTLYTCSAGQQVPAVQAQVQHGYQQAIDMVRSLYPSTSRGEFLVLGNIDGYGLGAGAPYKTSIQGKYDLAMAEDPFGRYEQNQGGVYSTMLASLTGMEVCLRPGLNHFMVGLMESMSFNGNVGPNNFPTNQSSWNAANWQAARYQFANFTLLRWVAMFSNPSATNVWLFDELLGGPTQIFQWLGQPIGPRDLTAWKQGLRKGDFANGSVIVNPKGNGAQTFTMPYSGHRLATAGFGDAAYNNGAAFTTSTSMTLQDRDAIFVRNT